MASSACLLRLFLLLVFFFFFFNGIIYCVARAIYIMFLSIAQGEKKIALCMQFDISWDLFVCMQISPWKLF